MMADAKIPTPPKVVSMPPTRAYDRGYKLIDWSKPAIPKIKPPAGYANGNGK
tara:strand:+ start:194 stop:349 length:156 start_codon:yes stop_codon:yes gene_type:complete